MAIRIPVSRHGLTECLSCRKHIRIEQDWTKTICPFCGIALKDSISSECDEMNCAELPTNGALPILRKIAEQRSTAMAASLLSFTLTVAACEKENVVPLYGLPAPSDSGAKLDTGGVDMGVADTGPNPIDGSVADVGDAMPGDVPVTDAQGRDAADATTNMDATMDADTPIALYGLPPPDDAG